MLSGLPKITGLGPYMLNIGQCFQGKLLNVDSNDQTVHLNIFSLLIRTSHSGTMTIITLWSIVTV